MPILTIPLPQQYFREVKKRAQRQGFRTPSDWARFLIESNIALEESPKLTSLAIILAMEKTGLYQEQFLSELKKSIDYADKAA